MEDPPKVELKDLPSHLQNTFLGNNKNLLVIIAVDVQKKQIKALFKVLKKHVKSIGWTIADIVGIPQGLALIRSN